MQFKSEQQGAILNTTSANSFPFLCGVYDMLLEEVVLEEDLQLSDHVGWLTRPDVSPFQNGRNSTKIPTFFVCTQPGQSSNISSHQSTSPSSSGENGNLEWMATQMPTGGPISKNQQPAPTSDEPRSHLMDISNDDGTLTNGSRLYVANQPDLGITTQRGRWGTSPANAPTAVRIANSRS
jgi:hypothetical protein